MPDIGSDQVAWLGDQFVHILTSAIDGDMKACRARINEVNAKLGEMGVFAVVCAVAEFIVQRAGMNRRPPSPGYWAFTLIDAAGGQQVNPDSVTDRRGAGVVWATRFVTAIANQDDAQQWALFRSTQTQEEATDRVSALLRLANLHGKESQP